MTNSDYTRNLFDLLQDPIKVSIWLEILRKPGITAKELSKKLDLKGTTIYYYLKQIADKKLVKTVSEPIPSTNLTQMRYSIIQDFFDAKKNGSIKKIAQEYPKEVELFELYLMISVINQRINQLTRMTQEEYIKIKKKENDSFGELFFADKQILSKLFKKYAETTDILKNLSLGDTIQEQAQKASHSLIFTCFPLS